MRTRYNRRPIYAVLGLVGLVLLGLLVGIYRSGGQRLTALNRTLRERRDTLARLEGRVATLKKLEVRCRTLRRRLAILEPALPEGEYVPTFLRQIENLARDTKNELSSIKPKPVVELALSKPKAAASEESLDESLSGGAASNGAGAPASERPYETLMIEMGMQGQYWDLLRFLDELGQFPKMIAVNEISLKGMQRTGSAAAEQTEITTSVSLVALIHNREPKQWKNGVKS